MSLRDEIADIVRHWKKGWHSLDVADAVLALLRERATEMYHGMTISWSHDGPLWLLDLGEP